MSKLPNELVALLTAVSNDFEDHTAKLVAADWCQENDYHSLEWLLRYLANIWQAPEGILFTGSRYYGTPREESDFDWVLYCTFKNAGILIVKADSSSAVDIEEDQGTAGIDTGLRFGPLNVIVVTTEAQWQAWKSGTEILKGEAPVTRERAVEVFQEAFTSAGLEVPDDEFSGDTPEDEYEPPWYEYEF